MKPKPSFIELLRQAGRIDSKHHPATLYRDGQAVAIGTVLLEEASHHLAFVPRNGKTLDTPIHAITLKLMDTGDEVGGIDLEDCPTREHYHLTVPRIA
jgi:hypothetical protein